MDAQKANEIALASILASIQSVANYGHSELAITHVLSDTVVVALMRKGFTIKQPREVQKWFGLQTVLINGVISW